jgi:DNA-binding NtrC family response regulator
MNPEKSMPTDDDLAQDGDLTSPGASEAVSESEPHERQAHEALPASLVNEALRIVQSIAEGGDPYSSDPARRYKPESHPDTVKALCVVAAFLAERRNQGQDSFVPSGTIGNRESSSLDGYLKDIERAEIVRALEAAKYNKTEAARLLGISFRALRYKVTQLGIE